MARLLKSLRQVWGLSQSSPPAVSSSPTVPISRFARLIDTDFSYFREGDRVIVQGKNPLLTKPLRKGEKSDVRRGQLEHDKIIGRRVRDLIEARKGPEYRLTLPSLEEYVSMTPRLVTPIYAQDANLIVSLLDIHVSPPGEGGDGLPPLEILESGTGHGSLTLHLARAVQAANSLPPPIPETSQVKNLKGHLTPPGESDSSQQYPQDGEEKEVGTTQQNWDAWRSQRKAIIHTVDVSPKFSKHAEKIVRGFRRGVYTGNVDFYAGHVENWIAEQIRQRTSTATSKPPDPFLSYAILDMPSSHLRIPHVVPILKRDGILAVFMPSVTQIGDCVDLIRKQNLPLILEKAVELGSGISGGRLWDVRFAVKKSRADPSTWTNSSAPAVDAGVETSTQESSESMSPSSEEESVDEEIQAPSPKEPEAVLVCRPKVGPRIVGGGFVGIFRRIEDYQDTQL